MHRDVPMAAETQTRWDVVIVGGGFAGLSAALILGRACRRVLVVDAGRPRNWASEAIWGYLGHDGTRPDAFRDRAHAELARYETVETRQGCVVDVTGRQDAFSVELASGERVSARSVLVASGVIDRLPKVPGLEPLFGKSVFQCPYCDGWQVRGRRLGVYGRGESALAMVRAVTGWSSTVIWFGDGPGAVPEEARASLAANAVRVEERRVRELESRDGKLLSVRLEDGTAVPCDGLFVDMPSDFQSDLVRRLGCSFNEKGGVDSDRYEATDVPGVFVAGNIVKDVQLAIVAAAEGAKAAFGVNRWLTRRDFDRRDKIKGSP